MPTYTFEREERLKSRKIISKLFKEGHSFGAYPLRLVWVPLETTDNPYPVKVAFTVPKRAFPKAAHRNQIKRQIREAYRLQKHKLYQELATTNQQFGCMILFIAKEPLEYKVLEKATQKMIKTFLYKLKNS